MVYIFCCNIIRKKTTQIYPLLHVYIFSPCYSTAFAFFYYMHLLAIICYSSFYFRKSSITDDLESEDASKLNTIVKKVDSTGKLNLLTENISRKSI